MRFLVHTTSRPAFDLALEESLQVGLEEGASPPTWRVWQARIPALVMGTGQVAQQELDLDAAASAGVPVLRRHSGGGAVLVGPGVINYSGFYRIVDLPGAETITGAMKAVLKPVVAALERLGVRAREEGLSDLVVEGQGGRLLKIAGNAQARKRVSVVVHGTLLADPDWALLERLIRFPTRPPEYRGGRSHRAFLTSLAAERAKHDLPAFAEALAAELGREWQRTVEPVREEWARANDLCLRKYDLPEWNLRR